MPRMLTRSGEGAIPLALPQPETINRVGGVSNDPKGGVSDDR